MSPARPFRLVVVGHVDHGKSTLIGRLLHDAGALPDGRIEQLAAAASRRGAGFEFANLTDGLQAERDQNVTIDTTQVLFRADGRDVLFIDAPGHREFIRNMVTGASQAEGALLVIDAVDGVSDQTRRHALLLTILGITRLIVVVNKIDLLPGSDQRTRFDQLSAVVTNTLAPMGLTPAAVIPAAASLGWNVFSRADMLDWFSGPTVNQAVAQLSAMAESAEANERAPVFSVQDVYRRDTTRWLVGRQESGTFHSGDAVTVLPAGHVATIDLDQFPGSTGALTIREPLFVSRGDVLAAPGSGLIVADTIRARVFWLGRSPLSLNRRYEVRLATQHADAEVASIERVIDASLLTERGDRSHVPAHDVADVTLRLSRPLVVSVNGQAASLARFVIVDAQPSPDIVGGGVVVTSTPAIARTASLPVADRVTAQERHHRFGHRGAVVWLTGLSGAGKSTLADGLERALFERGLQTTVLDGDRVRFGLNADLGFSPDDRRENIRRIAEVAKLFAESGMIAISAFVSPSAADRRRARDIVSAAGLVFIEVFVDTALDVCEARDTKGLYRKARAGEIAEFTGVSAPYDAPTAAELVIRTAECSVAEGVARLIETVSDATRLHSPASGTSHT